MYELFHFYIYIQDDSMLKFTQTKFHHIYGINIVNKLYMYAIVGLMNPYRCKITILISIM